MREDRYTELFFLDEASALAAGHRPCGMCKNHHQVEFIAAWQGIFPDDDSLEAIDLHLHRTRIHSRGLKVIYEADRDDLRSGTMIRDPHSSDALLIRNEFVYR
ncbi:MAG TPA: hypothetical protein VIJ86_11595 [Acidimicrobiales bacterium]